MRAPPVRFAQPNVGDDDRAEREVLDKRAAALVGSRVRRHGRSQDRRAVGHSRPSKFVEHLNE